VDLADQSRLLSILDEERDHGHWPGCEGTGFNLKAQGWGNVEWLEAQRAVQFLREYEAYRALLDASTAASAGTSGQ
jgi:hypothetical protein